MVNVNEFRNADSACDLHPRGYPQSNGCLGDSLLREELLVIAVSGVPPPSPPREASSC